MRGKGWLVPAVALGSCAPGLVVVVRAALGKLGPDPVATATNQLGLAALALLVASLLATPARLLTGATWPVAVRRVLGLAAFGHALAHLAAYAVVDRALDLAVLVEDALTRPFLMAGFAAFVAMVPLALTSTRRARDGLGATRWQRLHRLAYLAGVLGVVHYLLRVKADRSEPALYGAALVAGFVLRLFRRKPRGVRRDAGTRSADEETGAAAGKPSHDALVRRDEGA